MIESTTEPAAARAGRVFTVPPGLPFLDCLAAAILAGDLPAPGGAKPSALELPDYTILLPTRRAARTLQEAFLKASGRSAMLLPRIKPIAEGEEDLSLLAGLVSRDTLAGADADIPPAISAIERQLVLTELVMRWSAALRGADGGVSPAAGAGTPAQAANLARELARLMDMVETENVSLAGIADLVSPEFSEHWQQTLAFLEIVTRFWPEHLREKGLSSPADHRNRVIIEEARRMASTPPARPVIIAGVTGSIPATAALMRAVADLPLGAIVLPGLDTMLDDPSWQAIAPATPAAEAVGHPDHPQFGFAKLLRHLDVPRACVRALHGAAAGAGQEARSRLVSQMMRPAGSTEQWHAYTKGVDKPEVAAALKGVSCLAAPTAHDEAEAVALILREAAEHEGRTAALVSPDRLLARRVANRLEAWGIKVDDSAGRPFGKTVPGAFLDLTIEAVAEDFSPTALMALLKHPLCRLGLPVAVVRRAARALEIAVFRAAYLGRGLDAVDAALERSVPLPRGEGDAAAGPPAGKDVGPAYREAGIGQRRTRAARRLWSKDHDAARDLMRRLSAAFAPLVQVFAGREPRPLASLVAAHVASAEALSAVPDGAERSPLWQDGEAGEAAALFLGSILDPALPAPLLSAADYPDFYRSLIASENVRPRTPVHPRLSIWGPFEARLQRPDVVVLGSLNDGTWPERADPGPWLNRTMRAALGLPSPEERIGFSALDFTTLLGADTVYLTRAEKIDGVPTVPSRWIMRLEALLKGMGALDLLQPAEPWLGWARTRDAIPERKRLRAPEPRPPVKLRPRRITVSKVESWIANPYQIFASDILGLEKLPGLGDPPDAALRGGVVHEALGRFAARYPSSLPSDVKGELLRTARAVLAEYSGHPRVAAFWLPRFERFAEWFADTEPRRRQGIERVIAEVAGEMLIETAPAGPFRLHARADRIDIAAGGAVITDYKTGTPPSDKSVVAGYSPQLPLEAAMLAAGAFTGLPPTPAKSLTYIRASGGEPPGVERIVKADDLAGLARGALAGLQRLIADFDDPDTPYRAVRRARFSYEYDDYAHLARVDEWAGDVEGEG